MMKSIKNPTKSSYLLLPCFLCMYVFINRNFQKKEEVVVRYTHWLTKNTSNNHKRVFILILLQFVGWLPTYLPTYP